MECLPFLRQLLVDHGVVESDAKEFLGLPLPKENCDEDSGAEFEQDSTKRRSIRERLSKRFSEARKRLSSVAAAATKHVLHHEDRQVLVDAGHPDYKFAVGIVNELDASQYQSLVNMRAEFADKTCQEIEQGRQEFLLNDATLLRFLMQKNFNEKKAIKLLHKHLEWRDKFLPSLLTVDDVQEELGSGIVRRAGLSKESMPVVWIQVKNFWPKQYKTRDHFVKLCAFFFEYNIRLLEPDVFQGVIVFDLAGFNLKQHYGKESTELLKLLIHVVQEQYPWRMRKIYVVNAPSMVSIVWNAIKVLLDKELKEKILFVKKTTVLTELIDEDVLPLELGGQRTEPYLIDLIET